MILSYVGVAFVLFVFKVILYSDPLLGDTSVSVYDMLDAYVNQLISFVCLLYKNCPYLEGSVEDVPLYVHVKLFSKKAEVTHCV